MRHDTYLQLLFALLRTVPEVSHPPPLQTLTLQERTLISCCHEASPPAAPAQQPQTTGIAFPARTGGDPGLRKSISASSWQKKALAISKWRGTCELSFCLPSSAFLSHSTNFFICSRKTLFPFARCASLYHFRMGSSLRTSAVRCTRVMSTGQNTK